jgi:hypothetical protein
MSILPLDAKRRPVGISNSNSFGLLQNEVSTPPRVLYYPVARWPAGHGGTITVGW